MKYTILVNLILCLCAAAGFMQGALTYFKPKAALYAQMVTAALGCAALGRLYNIAVLICDGEIPRTFNTGVLATIGCFMFIFSANYGQMDSLCDMTDARNKKVRYIALIAPLILLGAAVGIWLFCEERLILKVTCIVQIAFLIQASYYNCKHLLMHDVEYGIIGSIRGYNLMMLLLELLYTAEIVCNAFLWAVPLSIVSLVMSICLILVIPALMKGGRQWKI